MTGFLRLPEHQRARWLFGLLAAAVVTAEYWVAHQPALGYRPELPPAVALDLLVVLPGLAYWLLVRRGQLPRSAVVAVFGAGLALSHWLLPAGGLPLLVWAGRLAQALEALALGLTAVRLRRVWQGYQAARRRSVDFVENIHAAAQALPGLFGRVLLTEAAVFRYGLLGFWTGPEVGPGQQAFTTYRQSGFAAMLATLAGLSTVELVAAHLLVAHWHPQLAWGLSAASAYSLLWLLAHGQAVRCRPVLLTEEALVVRVGFCWRATIERRHIASCQLLKHAPAAAPGQLDTARLLLAPPTVGLILRSPQVVHGLFGRRQVVTRLAFYVDEPVRLAQQLAA